jgi:hypothetical protein
MRQSAANRKIYIGLGVFVALTAVAAPGAASAQTTGPSGQSPSVYVQEAVLSVLPSQQPGQRPIRSCTITALLRQWCGTATSCDVSSQAVGTQRSFFAARAADIAQICSLQLSQVTDFRVTYRCRYGEQFDGTIIQETRGIAVDDSGAPVGRSAFRVLMACH